MYWTASYKQLLGRLIWSFGFNATGRLISLRTESLWALDKNTRNQLLNVDLHILVISMQLWKIEIILKNNFFILNFIDQINVLQLCTIFHMENRCAGDHDACSDSQEWDRILKWAFFSINSHSCLVRTHFSGRPGLPLTTIWTDCTMQTIFMKRLDLWVLFSSTP